MFIKKPRWLDEKLLRFLIVGVINTLVGAGVMFALYNLLNVGYWLSSAANYVAGGIVSYFLNKHFTFQNKERSAAQLFKFILNLAVCYLVAYGLAKPLVGLLLGGLSQELRDNAALFCGMCLYTLLNYFGQRFFAFRASVKLSFPVIWIAVVLLLEILCFNFNSYHLMGGDYPEQPLDLSAAQIQGAEMDENGRLIAGGSFQLEWNDLNCRVGTIALKMELTDAATAELAIDASDDTNQAYRYSIASAKLIAGNEHSQTVLLRMSGEVHDLRLRFTLPENSTVTLTEVAVNQAVPFHFSALRTGLLLFVGLFFWLLLTGKPLKQSCAEQPRLLRASVQCVTLLCILFAFMMVLLYASTHSEGLLAEFRLTSGNQITQELVDAFEAKQVHLLTEPSEELLALDNPYDWSARSDAGVSYLWDHCLYNGHYYSYYGISLVLLLFLPYHLLTGYYFSTILAVLLCGVVGILFLSMTYYAFVRKFFPKIPVRLALCGLITLQLSSGIWFCFCAANFYEIAQASGFCFVTAGAYFLLTSNVIGEGRISAVRVAVATTCLSLAVLSRPTTAVYCVVALVFLGFGLKKAIAERNAERSAEGGAEDSAVNSVERSVEDSTENSAESSAERGVVRSAEGSTAFSAEDSSEGSAKGSTGSSAGSSAENSAKGSIKRGNGRLIAYILAAVLPFMLLGGLQMIYNYLRFDSFFDFGIQYSLTINDFTRAEYHTRFVSIGFYNYLLAPPVISPVFPYVTSSFQSLSPNGYYFVANTYAVGLIWRAMPVLGLLLAPKALRLIKSKEKKWKAIALIGSLSIAAPLAVIFSIWESGYGARYCVDFGWEMLIGALAVLFFLYENCRNEGVREIGCKAFIWSLIPTWVINFALCYAFFRNEVHSVPTDLFFANFESIFNFWF